MKKILLMLSVLAICFASCQKVNTENTEEEEGTELSGDDIIPFKDPNFLEALISLGLDYNQDGQISVNEAYYVNKLSLNSRNISDISEIQYFTGLTYLDCSDNQLTALNVNKCPELEYLDCSDNQFTTLDVSDCPQLSELDCSNNQLTTLDVSNCLFLSSLDCNNNQLGVLAVNPNLWELDCSYNQLIVLDVSNCSRLSGLDCSYNQLVALDLGPDVKILYCRYNQLATLDISNCPRLSELHCANNQLTALDVSNCPHLYALSVYKFDEVHDNHLQTFIISQSQLDASWLLTVRFCFPDIEIIVKEDPVVA